MPFHHHAAVWAQRCGAGGCRREATWIVESNNDVDIGSGIV